MHVDATSVAAAVTWQQAVDALRRALLAGLDPEAEPPRTAAPFGDGELLTMSSGGFSSRAGRRLAAVKLATVAPDAPTRTLPRVHALCVLFDAETLAPVATLDGGALTSLRTPAVSALGVDLLAPADATRLVVFGTGPQAHGHVHALRAVRPIDYVRVVGRDPQRTREFVGRLRRDGVPAEVARAESVAEADVVACCTTARQPVFDGTLLGDTAVVVACGSHEPAAREVDAETVARCGVAVESVTAACREAGDVILAISEGALRADQLIPLADLVRGATQSRPRLVKTVGMGWQDLVVATAVLDAIATPA